MKKILVMMMFLMCLTRLNCESITFTNGQAEKVKKMIVIYPNLEEQVMALEDMIYGYKEMTTNMEYELELYKKLYKKEQREKWISIMISIGIGIYLIARILI